jgi:hypothetical protein
MLEACNELAIGSEEQVLPFPLEVVFGELIHCYKYIGTVNKAQAFLVRRPNSPHLATITSPCL